MIKNIIFALSFLVYSLSSIAQNSNQDEITPQKGDFMVSVNFGVGSYIGMSAPAPDLGNYTLSAPMTAWFDKNPILDIEGRWFVTDQWALKLTGGLSFGHNPGYDAIQGTGSKPEDIPTYNAVPKSNNFQFAVSVGAERYCKTKMDRLFFRIGGEIGYAYGRNTAKSDDVQYMGSSLAEAYTLKVAPVAGLDYFFNQVLFVGVDIRPIAYHYSRYSMRPKSGMKLMKSDGHTFSLISQPMIKLGFRF